MANEEANDKTAAEGFDAWFDRELAAIKRSLAHMEASLSRSTAEPTPVPAPPSPPQSSNRPTKPELPSRRRSMANSGTANPPPPAVAGQPAGSTTGPAPAPAAPSAAPAPAPAAWPTGSELSDPKNFGLRPPMPELEQNSASHDEFRQRLARHISFATKVLHTSRVRAEVWREWRAFEKTAQDRLRTLQITVSAE